MEDRADSVRLIVVSAASTVAHRSTDSQWTGGILRHDLQEIFLDEEHWVAVVRETARRARRRTRPDPRTRCRRPAPRNTNAAFRARTARSAPIASLVQNPGSLFPFAKCFAGVYGTASTG